MLVNSSERKKPPQSRSPIIRQMRRRRREEAIAPEDRRTQQRIEKQHVAEAEGAQDRRAVAFIAIAPSEVMKVMLPD